MKLFNLIPNILRIYPVKTWAYEDVIRSHLAHRYITCFSQLVTDGSDLTITWNSHDIVLSSEWPHSSLWDMHAVTNWCHRDATCVRSLLACCEVTFLTGKKTMFIGVSVFNAFAVLCYFKLCESWLECTFSTSYSGYTDLIYLGVPPLFVQVYYLNANIFLSVNDNVPLAHLYILKIFYFRYCTIFIYILFWPCIKKAYDDG